MKKSDIELIHQFKKGNKEVFDLLVERYHQKIYNTCYRMLGNSEDAQDITQETFIKLFKNLNSFKEKSSFSTWVFMITTNICRDKLRKRKNNKETESIDEKEYLLNDNKISTDTPEEVSILHETGNQIQSEINKLPDKHKEVVILREFEALSYNEISKVLDISLGTVKSRLSRARSSLRKSINNIIKGGLLNES